MNSDDQHLFEELQKYDFITPLDKHRLKLKVSFGWKELTLGWSETWIKVASFLVAGSYIYLTLLDLFSDDPSLLMLVPLVLILLVGSLFYGRDTDDYYILDFKKRTIFYHTDF